MAEADIKQWIGSLIGPNTGFRSPRQLSVASGLSHNTVSNIWETGRGDPDSLGKIADTVGRRRVEVYLMAGWLEPGDLDESITEETGRLITLYFSLPEDARSEWLESGERLLRLLRGRTRPSQE